MKRPRISAALTSELQSMAPKWARSGFFAKFLAAMHESRRCQAVREIRRFEHLLREARAYEIRARQIAD